MDGHTLLEQFIQSRRIRPAHLAREAGYARQYVQRIRSGKSTPTTRCARALAAACRRLTREPVTWSALFGDRPIHD